MATTRKDYGMCNEWVVTRWLFGFVNLVVGCMYVYIMIVEQRDGKERRQEMRRRPKGGENDSEKMRNVLNPGMKILIQSPPEL